MSLKSERLKKLEGELNDLEQWLKLGLVPKKDEAKHKEEIKAIKAKVEEETQRLNFLKETGEVEEYAAPKKGARPAYQEPQSMPDLEERAAEPESTGFNSETTTNYDSETSTGEETTSSEMMDKETNSQMYDDDDDPYSDKNRWKRGILEDPDDDNW